MKIIYSNVVIFLLMAASFFISVLFYPIMPDDMASHWNAKGEVDGYMPKFWALFSYSFSMTALSIFFYLIPKIDPLKANIRKFKKYYKGFIIVLFVFLLVVQMQIILWNLGIHIIPNLYLPVLCAILFYYFGILCEHARPNWFVGIRTPWTLTSNRVWDKTHRLGGRLFKLCSIIALPGVLVPQLSIYLVVIPILLVSIFTIIYSYVEFQKITA